MFETICNLIPVDPDYPARTRTLDILTRVLNGTIYDVLPYEFHDERNQAGEYIPLRYRRPSWWTTACRWCSARGIFPRSMPTTAACAGPSATSPARAASTR